MTVTVSPFGVPVAPPLLRPTASANATATASGWRIQERPGSGLFVVSEAGTILFRIEPDKGLIYPWCKKLGREVPVALARLPMAAF